MGVLFLLFFLFFHHFRSLLLFPFNNGSLLFLFFFSRGKSGFGERGERESEKHERIKHHCVATVDMTHFSGLLLRKEIVPIDHYVKVKQKITPTRKEDYFLLQLD